MTTIMIFPKIRALFSNFRKTSYTPIKYGSDDNKTLPIFLVITHLGHLSLANILSVALFLTNFILFFKMISPEILREAYLELSQTSKLELFTKIVNGWFSQNAPS